MWWVNGCSLAGKNYKWPGILGDRRSPRSCHSVSFANTILCVTYPPAFTFARQCDRKPHSNNALISAISVSFQPKRHHWVAGIPISLPFLHLFNHASFSAIFILFSPPPSYSHSHSLPPTPSPSSNSLFSITTDPAPLISHFKLILVLLPFPSPNPLRFPASWLTGDNFQYHNQLETWVNIDHRSLKVVVRVSEHIRADTNQGGVVAELSFLPLGLNRAWGSTCLGARRPPCVLKLTRPLILTPLCHAFP